MRCLVCGTGTKTRRENYKYDVCGLPYVTLVGVEVSRCPKCGEYEVAIPRSEELHRVIADAVARKPVCLEPFEIRFLRKWLGWSGADFANHMGVSPETVSRWENGPQKMGGTAERLLRFMALSQQPNRVYDLDVFREIATKAKAPFRLGVQDHGQHWQAAPA